MRPAELSTDRLRLVPLQEADADSMLSVLSDARLYAYTGERPPTIEELRDRYRRQVSGAQPGLSEEWFNWIMRLREDETSVGFIQATVSDGGAELAWLVGVPWQNRGLATEAVTAMRDWLGAFGVERFTAHIHPHHLASQRVAARIDLRRTGTFDVDGEEVWVSDDDDVERDVPYPSSGT
jgi:RimJ/RimL family protein N-acetyltransferase